MYICGVAVNAVKTNPVTKILTCFAFHDENIWNHHIVIYRISHLLYQFSVIFAQGKLTGKITNVAGPAIVIVIILRGKGIEYTFTMIQKY